jgi:hypothetical protein
MCRLTILLQHWFRMTDTVQLSLFFCEDVRMEITGKPFLIGMLAPVIYGSNGGGHDQDFFLVTSVTSPAEIHRVDLQLTVTITGPDREPVSRTQTQTVDIGDDEDHDFDEPWKAWLPLRVVIPNCVPGSRVTAEVKSDYVSAWATLAVKDDMSEDGWADVEVN